MARTVVWNCENLLAFLPKKKTITPKLLKNAALKLLAVAPCDGTSPAKITASLTDVIAEAVKALSAQGRIDRQDKGACLYAFRENNQADGRIRGEFRQATARLLTEEAFLADAEEWMRDFRIFGSGEETSDDVNKAVTAIRALQSIHDCRPRRVQKKREKSEIDREQAAIDRMKARFLETLLFPEQKLFAILQQKHHPAYDYENLRMPNPAHAACTEELIAYRARIASKTEPFKETPKDRQTTEETAPRGGEFDDFELIFPDEDTPRGEKFAESRPESAEGKTPVSDIPKSANGNGFFGYSAGEAEDLPSDADRFTANAESLKPADGNAAQESQEGRNESTAFPVASAPEAQSAQTAETVGAEQSGAEKECPPAGGVNDRYDHKEENASVFGDTGTKTGSPAGDVSAAREENLPESEEKGETPAEAEKEPPRGEFLPYSDAASAYEATPRGEKTAKNPSNEEAGDDAEISVVQVPFSEGWNLMISKEVPKTADASGTKQANAAREKEAQKAREKAEEDDFLTSLTRKRLLVTLLDDNHALTAEEIARFPRLSVRETVALVLQKTNTMNETEKAVYFDRVKSADAALFGMMRES